MAIRKRVFVLGAGVSHECGYPLASDLIKSVVNFPESRLSNEEKEEVKNYIGILFPTFDKSLENYPNVEDFLNILDSAIERQVPIAKDLEKIRRYFLFGICQYLYSCKTDMTSIETFIDCLQEGDYIISFNWDLSLEKTIIVTKNRSYQYFIKGNLIIPLTGRPNGSSITILKPHGCINWFHLNELKLEEDKVFELDKKPPKEDRSISVLKLFDYPALPPEIVNKKPLPYIIPPTIYSRAIEKEVSHVWNDITYILRETSEIHFVGYSLPSIDNFARFTIRIGILLNKNGPKVLVVNPDDYVIPRYNALLGYNEYEFKPWNFQKYVDNLKENKL